MSAQPEDPKRRACQYVNDVLRRLDDQSSLSEAAVVLLGSAARGTQTWRSDVDILVITPEPVSPWRTNAELHVRFETRREFLSRVKARDDFAAWALRYGRVKSDESGWWRELVSSDASTMWPAWKPKLELAFPRLSMGVDLLEMGDLDAAEEEFLTAASHLARALLIQKRVFPLSRAELPEQLRRIQAETLADCMDRLLKGDIENSELRSIADTLREILGLLDSQ